jgi:hypothetical protein
MKTITTTLLMAALVTTAMGCVAQESSATEPAVLDDGARARTVRVENMHQVRFIEIFLAAREAETGKLVAACYNTMFTPAGIPASRDTAPQERVQGLDFAGL